MKVIKGVKLPDSQQLFIQMVVTHVVDCAHFWAYYDNETTWNIMSTLHNHINSNPNNLRVSLDFMTTLSNSHEYHRLYNQIYYRLEN